jgi:pilus assembly protein TadC
MNHDIIDLLNDKNLFLLAEVLQKCELKESELIEGRLRREIGIDISDINSIRELTDDQFEAINKFALDNKRMLLSMLNEADKRPEKADIDEIHLINFKYRLATILIIMSLLYVFAVSFYEVPQANSRFVDTSVGMIISMVIGVIVPYFFGGPKKPQDGSPQNPPQS